MKNIVILNGSPHTNGTTAHLVDSFLKGLEGKAEIQVFDVASMNIHPCIGCDTCGCGEKPCVFQDDMERIVPALLSADVVVFASPTYYFGLTAQLKTVIDRFYEVDHHLLGAKKTGVLIACAAGDEESIKDGVLGTYHDILHYLKWEDGGIVYALSCGTPEDLEKTPYLRDAADLAHSIL